MPTYEHIGYANLHAGAVYLTTAGRFDANYSNNSIRSQYNGEARLDLQASTTEAWFHFTMYKESSSGSGDGAVLRCRDVNDDSHFVLTDSLNSTTHILSYRDSGALVTGPNIVFQIDTLYTIDVFVSTAVGGAGSVQFYINDQLEFEVSGLTGTGNDIGYFSLWNSGHEVFNTTRADYYYSEFLVGIGANSATVGRRVYNHYPSAVSATNADWIGTDVSYISSTSGVAGATAMYTTTTGQREGFEFPALPAINAQIDAVGIHTESITGVGSTINYGHTIRVGGTDFDEPSLGATMLPGAFQTVTYNNPNTGLPWTTTEFDSAEFGIVSV